MPPQLQRHNQFCTNFWYLFWYLFCQFGCHFKNLGRLLGSILPGVDQVVKKVYMTTIIVQVSFWDHILQTVGIHLGVPFWSFWKNPRTQSLLYLISSVHSMKPTLEISSVGSEILLAYWCGSFKKTIISIIKQ